jgi:hypothetical protein
MDLDLIKWLNMVWGALEEQDSSKRSDMLVNANSFLEQTRGLQGAAVHADLAVHRSAAVAAFVPPA